MDLAIIARAIHVLAVVHWIGGVSFVTSVVLPSLASNPDPGQRWALFEQAERRFSGQVKISVPLAGLSGIYMVDKLGLWGRFLQPSGWWLAAMAAVWLLFMLILFVVEPLVAHSWFERQARIDPAGAFRLLQRAHWLLLTISAAVLAAGVLGAHGYID